MDIRWYVSCGKLRFASARCAENRYEAGHDEAGICCCVEDLVIIELVCTGPGRGGGRVVDHLFLAVLCAQQILRKDVATAVVSPEGQQLSDLVPVR